MEVKHICPIDDRWQGLLSPLTITPLFFPYRERK